MVQWNLCIKKNKNGLYKGAVFVYRQKLREVQSLELIGSLYIEVGLYTAVVPHTG